MTLGIRGRLRALILAEGIILAAAIVAVQFSGLAGFADRVADKAFGLKLEADSRSVGHYVRTYYGKILLAGGELVDRNLVPLQGRAELPAALKRDLGVESIIYVREPQGYRAVVSSLEGVVGSRLAEDSPAASGEARLGRERILEAEYFASFSPLLGLDDEAIGLVFLGLPRSFVDEAVAAERKKSVLAILGAAAAAVLLITLAAELILGASLAPLARLSTALRALAAGDGGREGVLSARISAQGRDEVGLAAESFNAFAERVSRDVGRAGAAMVALGSASTELAEGLAAVSVAAREISAEAGSAEEEASRRLTAFKSGREESSLIERESRSLAARSASVLGRASAAKEAVEGMARGLALAAGSSTRAAGLGAELRSRAAEGGARLAELAELSRELAERQERLGAANALIADVADRTSILALNAAIEAAHAGGYGRGFEVLAGEIRRLAEESAERSGEVAAVLGETAAISARSAAAAVASESAFAAMAASLAEVEDAIVGLDRRLSAEAAASGAVLEALAAMSGESAAAASSSEASREAATRVTRGMDSLIEGSRSAASRLEGIHRSLAAIEDRLDAMRELGARNERGAAAVGELLGALGGAPGR
ncbi:MAG: HAMP domain-containing protein [Spirochaetaceae bacterium]|nr:HAMP domain-containing protein [Spirochaetaceae bacterium]